MIKLSSPEIPESAISLAVDILRSGNLVQGKHVLELEKRLAEYLGTAECICVSSGTAALHLAILALELPAGSEAIVPGFTFPATANAAEVSGIHTNFADIRLNDCCIDPAELEKAWNPAVKVIIPVHEFGQSADMDPILAFAKEKNLFVIEDAACALGTEYKGHKCGTFGTLGCFSFHPRKAITSGEGGCIVTNDAELAKKIRILRNHGIDNATGKIDFVVPGLNYRMTDFQAALCLDQLAQFPEQIEKRRCLAKKYDEALKNISWITPPVDFADRRMVYQTYHVLLDPSVDRAKLISYLRDNGVETNFGAQALHLLSCYKNGHTASGQTMKNSAEACLHGLALPMGNHVKDEDLNLIVSLLEKFRNID